MKTMLVADDQASVYVLIRDYLSQEGFGIVQAENGRQALLAPGYERPSPRLLQVVFALVSAIKELKYALSGGVEFFESLRLVGVDGGGASDRNPALREAQAHSDLRILAGKA
ncbi:MAG TPA: hypothetical protein VH393_15045 [Ktedonobacterales bacterium]|jgi:CheY-like chemotaxis protein